MAYSTRKKYKKKKKKTSDISNLIPFVFIGIGLFNLTKNILYLFLISIVPIYFLIVNLYKLNQKKKRNKAYILSGIDIVDNLTGIEFEEFLLAHFINMGYKGNLTPPTNDYGADLLLYKDNEVIVVQAKRYSSKVGIEAIQQIIGAREYYNASKGMVITNSFYTPNASNLAVSSNIELWDRNRLLYIMSKTNGREEIIKSLGENVIEKCICKKCNSEMTIKSGRYGEFYGCTKYPKCTYTEQIK